MECFKFGTIGFIRNTSFSLLLANGPKKLERYITQLTGKACQRQTV